MVVRRAAWMLAGVVTFGAWTPSAFAQEDGEESSETAEPSADEEASSDKASAASEEETPKAQASSDAGESASYLESVTEKKGETYLFVGARYRMVVIPQFIQGIFADGGATALAQQPGLEFGIRKDGFEYSIFGMLGFYGLQDTPFKGKTDPNEAWEIVSANYQILFIGSDFMWSTPEFAPGLSVHYGAGVGVGIVMGKLERTQAYPRFGASPSDPGSYEKCLSQFLPNPVYCTSENNHYNGYAENSPTPIFPWIAGQIGLRYKIHRRFVLRLDAGIMVPGAFFGIGADFGL
jgi:hypothetical protein